MSYILVPIFILAGLMVFVSVILEGFRVAVSAPNFPGNARDITVDQALTVMRNYLTGCTEPWNVEILAALLKASNAKTVLECGGYLGTTSAWLALTLQQMGGGTFHIAELESERAAVAHDHRRGERHHDEEDDEREENLQREERIRALALPNELEQMTDHSEPPRRALTASSRDIFQAG